MWEIQKKNGEPVIETLNIYRKIKSKQFELSKKNSYILLVVEKTNHQSDLKDMKLKFPNSLTPLLNSIDNLTERGLSIPFAVSNEGRNFRFKIYLFNGRESIN